MYNIKHLRGEIEKLVGVKISLDQIRKLERAGLTLSERNITNNYREYSEESFVKSIRNLLYYYFNVPIKDILSDDPKVLQEWTKKIQKSVRKLSRG